MTEVSCSIQWVVSCMLVSTLRRVIINCYYRAMSKLPSGSCFTLFLMSPFKIDPVYLG